MARAALNLWLTSR